MHNCAFCKNPLRPLTEWKGNDGRFYCGEFCADTGDVEMPSLTKAAEVASTIGANNLQAGNARPHPN
jgi:hypothetical protein